MSTLGNLKLNLQQKPNSRERLIFLVGILVSILVFFKTCVVESRKSIDELQTKLDNAVAERKALDAEEALVKQASQSASNLKSDSARVHWIGKKNDVSHAADDLVKAAQDNNVYVVKFALPDFKDKQNYLFKPVNLTLAGALGDLGRFIESSERLQVPLVIDNLAFEQNPDFSDYITIRLEGGFYAEK